jgi:hypothetical protein
MSLQRCASCRVLPAWLSPFRTAGAVTSARGAIGRRAAHAWQDVQTRHCAQGLGGAHVNGACAQSTPRVCMTQVCTHGCPSARAALRPVIGPWRTAQPDSLLVPQPRRVRAHTARPSRTSVVGGSLFLLPRPSALCPLACCVWGELLGGAFCCPSLCALRRPTAGLPFLHSGSCLLTPRAPQPRTHITSTSEDRCNSLEAVDAQACRTIVPLFLPVLRSKGAARSSCALVRWRSAYGSEPRQASLPHALTVAHQELYS